MQSVTHSRTAKTTPKDWNPNFPYLEIGSYRTFDEKSRSTAALELTTELKTEKCTEQGRLVLNPNCENTRESKKETPVVWRGTYVE